MLKTVFFILISATAVAGLEDSFLCNDVKPDADGVTCCLSDKNECEAYKRQFFDKIELRQIRSLQADIAAEKMGTNVPNCFWAGLRFSSFQGKLRLDDIDGQEFAQALTREYRKLPKGAELVPGDVVVFSKQGNQRQPVFDDTTGALASVEWPRREKHLHASLYLGEGRVFQKEDMYSSVFSIASLRESFLKYEFNVSYNDPYFREVKYVKSVYRHR